MKTLTKLATLVLAATSFTAAAEAPAWFEAVPSYTYENNGYTLEEINKHIYTAALCTEALCENGSSDYISAYRFQQFMAKNKIGYIGSSVNKAKREADALRELLYYGKKFEFGERVSSFATDFENAMIFWEDADYTLSNGYSVQDLMYYSIDNPFDAIKDLDVNNEYSLLDSYMSEIRKYGTAEQKERLSKVRKLLTGTWSTSNTTEERGAINDLGRWWNNITDSHRSKLPKNAYKLFRVKDGDYYRTLSKKQPEAFEEHVLPFFDVMLDRAEEIADTKYREFLAQNLAETK
ncbi:hypothetical protein CZP2022_16 [Vibrio phage C-ZP2022]|nr:hypothetical protein CZP2022_16 [Vibrio phage C-ZP2022]